MKTQLWTADPVTQEQPQARHRGSQRGDAPEKLAGEAVAPAGAGGRTGSAGGVGGDTGEPERLDEEEPDALEDDPDQDSSGQQDGHLRQEI